MAVEDIQNFHHRDRWGLVWEVHQWDLVHRAADSKTLEGPLEVVRPCVEVGMVDEVVLVIKGVDFQKVRLQAHAALDGCPQVGMDLDRTIELMAMVTVIVIVTAIAIDTCLVATQNLFVKEIDMMIVIGTGAETITIQGNDATTTVTMTRESDAIKRRPRNRFTLGGLPFTPRLSYKGHCSQRFAPSTSGVSHRVLETPLKSESHGWGSAVTTGNRDLTHGFLHSLYGLTSFSAFEAAFQVAAG